MLKKLSLITAIIYIFTTAAPAFAVDFNDDISLDFLLGTPKKKTQPKKNQASTPKEKNADVDVDLDLDLGLEDETPHATPTSPVKKEETASPKTKTSTQKPSSTTPAQKSTPTPPKKASFTQKINLVTKVKKGLPFTTEETEYWVAENPDVNQCLDNGQTMLIYLITRYTDAESVAILLESGADLKTHCTPQYDALFMAALNNPSPEVLDVLINNGANLIAKDEDGNTALHLAAAFNPNPNIITTLIDNGLSPNAQNRFGQTPLHLSAFNNKNIKIAQTLLDYGANPNQPDSFARTPLMAAALADNSEMIEYLLSRNANLKNRDANNLSVLDYHNKTAYLKSDEFKKKNFSTLSAKLNAAFDFISAEHHKYNTLLKQSPDTKDPAQTADIAIQNHADIDILDKNGCTTLLNALKTNAPSSLIKKLLAAGANPNLSCQNQTTALIFAAQNAKKSPTNAIEQLALLLNYGANINQQDAYGKTALMYGLNSPEVTQNLIAAGADVNLKDNSDETALSYALKHHLSEDIILILINAETNLNTPLPNTSGDTPLLFAVKNDLSPKIVKQMLSKGADPKIADQNGLNTYDILKNSRYFNAAVKNKTRKDNLGSF